MDMKESWPYLAGAGLLVLLIALGRGGSSGGSTLTAIPTSNPASDALDLQREIDRAGILSAVVNSATALQGAVNGYRGQVAVTQAQYAGESTLATINADAQTAIAKVASERDITVNAQNVQSANVISSMNNKTARTTGVVGAVAGAVSSVVKALNPLSWF